jgi:hypothetical protein
MQTTHTTVQLIEKGIIMNNQRITVSKALARAAAAAAVTGLAALALASPASAQKLDRHLAVNCPPPLSQNCAPRQGLTATTTGELFVTFTADPNPPACAAGKARIFVDGNEHGSAIVQPGGNDGGYGITVSPGTHRIDVQMDGVYGGCNTGSMSGWGGNLHVETDADAENGAS